ncbi:MAG: DUF1015 domain-containing protein [Clostridia bacterium]|nr:DUF1015 domain-containing protein [Clostridia bacterium]
MSFPGIASTDIYLPAAGIDLHKWAVVACDQFTSQPEYWHAVEATVGDASSTLRLIQPEVFLEQGDNTAKVNATMQQYLEDGTLVPAVRDGFVVVERSTPAGKRLGLMAALDLECYDFTTGTLLTRATEGTVADRLPPRVKIRQNAPLELPHVLVLIDDPDRTVIEPLFAAKCGEQPLYDVELMQDGGHLRGWAVEDEPCKTSLAAALNALNTKANGFLYAVGDGNHSLATAKICWENVKATLSPAEQVTHPARYALVELENLHDEAILFEPIHRVLFHVDADDLLRGFSNYVAAQGMSLTDGEDIVFVDHGGYSLANAAGMLPVAVLQNFLDEYLKTHPATIDYIHGEQTVRDLCAAPDAVGILLTGIPKDGFFDGIRAGGHFPRKTFSMGEAPEKRYYMEARKIR